MATRTDNSVTLTHDEADLLTRLLSDMASTDFAQAKRTKSAAVRSFCQARGEQAMALEAEIVKRMWSWYSDTTIESSNQGEREITEAEADGYSAEGESCK
jgi:hypothetical protein